MLDRERLGERNQRAAVAISLPGLVYRYATYRYAVSPTRSIRTTPTCRESNSRSMGWFVGFRSSGWFGSYTPISPRFSNNTLLRMRWKDAHSCSVAGERNVYGPVGIRPFTHVGEAGANFLARPSV